VPVVFVKLALGPPLSAFAASLLFHAINNPMALLIPIVFFQRLPLSLVTFAGIFTLALFAPITQSIFGFAYFAKLALVFSLPAPGTLFHFL